MKEIESRVYHLICEQFSVTKEEVTYDTGPGDLAKWDSIGQLRLILAIEQEYDIQLSVDDVMSFNNVKNIIEFLTTKDSQIDKKKTSEQDEKVSVSYDFHPIRVPSTTYWGNGSLSVVKSFDFTRIALITGSSSYAISVVDNVRNLLPNYIDFQDFRRPNGEPNEGDIIRLAKKLSEFSPNHIIVVGGGSTIDIAKLSWLLYEKPDFRLSDVDSTIYDLNLRNKSTFTAIPTTFGSGSEVSSAAAFTKMNETNKTIFVSHDLIPDKVILDPSLGKGADQTVIYSSAFDALSHAIEGYVSIINYPPLEPSAIMAVKNILDMLNKMKSNGMTNEISETLCFSAYYSGIVQNHCSVGLTHSFAHQLGGFGVGHGLANALFLIPVIEFNSTRSNKYLKLINEIGYESVDTFINVISNLLNESSLLPIESDIFNNIVNNKSVIVDGTMEDITFRTNPVSLTKNEVEIVFDNFIEKIAK